MEPQQEVVVKSAERPHSMSYTRTAKDGWRPDTLKIYHSETDLNEIVRSGRDAFAVQLMRAMEATAREANGGDDDDGDN